MSFIWMSRWWDELVRWWVEKFLQCVTVLSSFHCENNKTVIQHFALIQCNLFDCENARTLTLTQCIRKYPTYCWVKLLRNSLFSCYPIELFELFDPDWHTIYFQSSMFSIRQTPRRIHLLGWSVLRRYASNSNPRPSVPARFFVAYTGATIVF